MLRLSVVFLIVTVICLKAVAAGAQTTPPLPDEGYAVELIIYEDLRDQALGTEYWAVDPGSPSVTSAIRLPPPISAPTQDEATPDVSVLSPQPPPPTTAGVASIQALTIEQLRLIEVWEALHRSKNYRPLLHKGWWQPDLGRAKTQPVYLSAAAEPPPNTPVAAAIALVEGRVAVYLQNYLHLSLDVIYRRALPSTANPGDSLHIPPKHYRLQATRRIRFDQLHYIDHPLFGVLLQIFAPETQLKPFAHP